MIRLKLFDFSLYHGTEKFDDEEMQEFMVDKELVSCTEHFFVHEGVPHLVVMLRYRDLDNKQRVAKEEKVSKKDWREELSAEETCFYDALRAWRTDRAKQEGVAVYMILTNQQIAEIVKKRPTNATELRNVFGVGKATMEKYGQEILECMSHVSSTLQAEAK